MEIITRNRKANDYDLTETLVAGIMLIGAEIKSVCRHEVDLTSAYILKRADGAYLINSYIAPPEQKQFFGVEYAPKRDRKLLLNKSELRFLNQQANKNKNIIPVEMFVADNGKVKLRLGVGTTLKKWDKRQKEREKAEKFDWQTEILVYIEVERNNITKNTRDWNSIENNKQKSKKQVVVNRLAT